MLSLEQQARSFFLRCRSTAWQARPRSSCQRAAKLRSQPRRASSSTAAGAPSEAGGAKKPFYVTTPIFYVNSSPHVGHLYSMILADILKRWQLLKRRPAQLLTGTDEHGVKVQRAALEAGSETLAFCTKHADQFKLLADTANISYDRFMRTTDSDHRDAVTYFWQELDRQGYIYQAKHEGWYCVSDETFYPENQVHAILVPATGEKIMASKETGKEVTWTSETNYHFRLSEFRERLLKHYTNNPDFIVPRERMNFIINEVEGLKDLSISRPKERLSWGISVPGDPDQTIYVWFDALINYITHAGYPINHESGCWPPEVQVIGKDIIRFHTIYWPAFLMALELPLPKQFLTHAHWTMNTAKMSKSLGNVVNPFSAMSRFGVDAIRWYMARDGGILNDSPYENSFISKRYKDELQGQIGNLLNRIVRGKLWDIPSCIEACEEELITMSPKHQEMFHFVGTRAKMKLAVSAMNESMEKLDIRDATTLAVDLCRSANRLLQTSEPWKLSQEASPDNERKLRWIIFEVAETLRVAMILLQPVMPDTMARGLDILGVPVEDRFWKHNLAEVFPKYGTPLFDLGPVPKSAGRKAGISASILFPALQSDD
jgi:methionyl-tRNA synthetase